MRILPILILVLVVLALLYVPMKLDYDLRSIGRVYPVREWSLIQEPGGAISAKIFDRISQASQQSELFQFERGDQVQAQLDLPNDSLGLVYLGDTVLRVQPLMIFNRITELKAQLAVAQANYQSAATGEKPPIVGEAQQMIYIAENTLRLAQQDYDMQLRLMKDSLVSAQELRTAATAVENGKTQVAAAKQFLLNVDTGVKPEDVTTAKKQIELLETQINFLQNQSSRYFLRAPFTGRYTLSGVEGELFTLLDETRYLLHIPIKIDDLRYINKETVIEVTDIVTGKIHIAKVLVIPQQVEIIGGQRVVLIQATLDRPTDGQRLSTGMSLDCRVRCGQINQREYILRSLRPPQ